ncbi:hypothetical protein Hanom_Chr15g01344561 [Helianthus anomalus]
MATPVATVAPPGGFNDDDDIFRSESIGVDDFVSVCFFPEIDEIRSRLLTKKELLWFLLRLLKAPQQVCRLA